jgi:uncharacterized protein (TIGR02996 family)
MSDEDALLAAIAEHPDEDTPRLVYADWLQEHDQPIRAEFIRLQIEIERKQETLPRVLLNRHVDLFKRQQELLDNHRNELLGPLAKLQWEATGDFSRGFVSQVELSVTAFLQHAPLVASTRPLPRVRVYRVATRFADFVLCPHIGCITQLQAYSSTLENGPPAWPDDEDMLDAGERLTRLEVLDLEGCGINDLHCDLAFNYSLPALVELDLSNNLITDHGVSNLIATGWQQQLKRLVLGGNPITDLGARWLAESWPTDSPLENLNLRFTDIGTSGQQALLARFGGKVELF